LYVWKVKGTQVVRPFPSPLPLPSFADRSVEGLVDDPASPGTNFSFSTRERDPSLNSKTIITRFFKVDQTNPTPALRGVLLTRIVTDKQDGSPKMTFDPQPDIMYLPLPVQIGPASAFSSTGVDFSNPTALQTLRHSGSVKERLRVDACGKVVDTWLVEAEQILGAGTSSRRTKFNYSIAPHFGGLILFEHVESPCNAPVEGKCTDAELVYDTNIGQTEPDSPGSR